MKIISISILRITKSKDEKAIILSSANDFSSFSFFQRSGIQEFCTFVGRTLATRVNIGTQQQIDKNEWRVYVHPRSSGICGVLICDKEYPSRVAFNVIYKCLVEYEKDVNLKNISGIKNDNSIKYPLLLDMLKKYQDPSSGDDLMKIQEDIKEVKTIMNKALENCMEKDENLNELVDQSTDLSYISKQFYDKSADNNRCCIMQ